MHPRAAVRVGRGRHVRTPASSMSSRRRLENGIGAPGDLGPGESKGGGRASRDDVDSRAAVAKLTRKPRETLDSFCVARFVAFPTLPSSPPRNLRRKDFLKKEFRSLPGPGSGKGIFEVDTSGSLGECGIPGPREGGGAGTSRDSRNPRRSGVCGYGCNSRQRRLLSTSEETVQQLEGEIDPVISLGSPPLPSHNNPVSRRLFSPFRQEFPGSGSCPFSCSRIIHRRRPQAPPCSRESPPVIPLPCGPHHLPRVPAPVMQNSHLS